MRVNSLVGERNGITTDPSSAYRYERKFATSAMSRAEIETLLRLNPTGFSEIYNERWINNIYLDSLSGESLWDNTSGVSVQRVKVRIRWYGSFEGQVGNPTLELKIRRGFLNRKLQFGLKPFRMDAGLSVGTVRDLFRCCGAPDALLHQLLNLEFALANRYRRTYFLSADKKFRATVDSEITFHALKAVGGDFPGRWILAPDQVLELKYGVSDDPNADRITGHFPLRLSRSSKFASGLELTHKHLGHW